MQIMWVSGPTAKVQIISITAQKVIVGLSVSALALVLFGVLLHFVGFRVAIEVNPSFARSLGGVTTEAEQQKVEAVYRQRLEALRQTLSTTVQQIGQLENLKNRFMEVATPVNLRDKFTKKEGGLGGPWMPPRLESTATKDLLQELFEAQDEFIQTQSAVKNLSRDWSEQLSWLRALPTGIPVAKEYHVTSGFGIRNDPFTGQLAMHEGIDFVAEVGTPIVVTAAGKVTRSGWDATYGNVIEVTHIEGFTTRYAHLSQRLVEVGQNLLRGDLIGKIGNTGRSTGPHLHYEILRHDRVLNPTQMLMQASTKVQ